ncbi:MAG: hypothetical protein JNL95_13775 [Chitinophagales bacterium]|nr:hypothetical protein [Chitinophagales bacterium]
MLFYFLKPSISHGVYNSIEFSKISIEFIKTDELFIFGYFLSEIMEKTEHRKIAVDCFNNTWNVLDKLEKTTDDQAEAILLAHTSLWHWLQCGEAINAQRGEWMIARVYAVFEMGEMALYHAKRCLELTQKHDFKDFDLSFGYESMARALAVLKRNEEALHYYNLAKTSAEGIAKQEDKDYFLSDLETTKKLLASSH